MATKYFRAENAFNPVGGVRFTVYGIIGGSHCGVYAADDEAEQQTLSSLGGSVQEITQSDYDEAIKKKRPDSDTTLTPYRKAPLSGMNLKGNRAVVVGGEGQEPEAPLKLDTKVETVDQALEVDSASPANEPAPIAQPKNRVKGKRENQ